MLLLHNQEMDATDFLLCDEGDDDYIDLELSSSPSRILCSSPQSREFEFQMSAAANESADTTSPADELFYKGKLLPLHLPPRQQMVQNLLLLHPTTAFEDSTYYYSSMPSTNAANTPLDSCNISPSESCRVSCDLNPDDYYFEWSNELNTFINNHPTKITWAKKLKLIKHSILGHKLKASKAYLKSFFVKSHDSSTKPTSEKSTPPEPTYPTIAAIMNGIEENGQRRSFSRAIKRHSPTKCSSSSSSNSSSGSSSFSGNLHELHCLRRSSSATEIECSIEGAIAHCKKSQDF